MNYAKQLMADSESAEVLPVTPTGYVSVYRVIGIGGHPYDILEDMLDNNIIGIARNRFEKDIFRTYYAEEPKVIFQLLSVRGDFRFHIHVTKLPPAIGYDNSDKYYFDFCVKLECT